jgi:hypothetical protein
VGNELDPRRLPRRERRRQAQMPTVIQTPFEVMMLAAL